MIVRTLKEWDHVVKKLKNSSDPEGTRVISFDTETVDRGYPNIHITGFSVAWFEADKRIDGAYVPVGHSTGELQLAPEDVFDGLRDVLEDESIEVAMQNAKYDIKVAALWPHPGLKGAGKGYRSVPGIVVSTNRFDTMVASWLLNTEGVGSVAELAAGHGSHGLKALSKYLLGYEMTELSELAPKEKMTTPTGEEVMVLRTDLVRIDSLGAYAYDDAVQTLKLREYFREKMEEDPKVKKLFYAAEREFVSVLAEMEMWGIELDSSLLSVMRQSVAEELDALRQEMYENRMGQDFAPIRDADLVRKLCERWDELEELFKLSQDDPRYPKRAVEKGPKGKKVTVLQPISKATARKQAIAFSGLDGHPVIEKIRDDKLRPELKRLPHLAHKIFNVNSNAHLNVVLFEECGIIPIGERNRDGLYSVAAENVDEWAKTGEPLAIALKRHNEINKLQGTYLIGMARKVMEDARLRGRFNRTGTRTGRLSSADPNLQNIPTSTEFPVRKAFTATGVTFSDVTVHEWYTDDDGNPVRPKHLTVEAKPGNPLGLEGGYTIREKRVVEWWGKNPPWSLFVGDYSQLEICLLAHISGDPTLVKAVTEGEDIHALTAQAVFKEIPDDLTLKEVKEKFPKLRKKAKPVNFGVIYGLAAMTLAATLEVSEEEAAEIINVRYFERYPGVKRYIEKQHAFAKAHGFVQTPIGRKRHLPDAQLDPYAKGTFGRIRKAERQAQNAPIQGYAADIMEFAMRDIRRFMIATQMDPTNPAMVMLGKNGEIPRPAPLACDYGPWVDAYRTPQDALWGNYMRMLLQVHDELVQEAHPAVANYVLSESCRIMVEPGKMKLKVPLRVDAALGTDWYSTKE